MPRLPNMIVTKTLRPGDKGTDKWVRKYGQRLVCVRYRHDKERRKNLTTVELVIDEREALGGFHRQTPMKPVPKQIVSIRVNYLEDELRVKVKAAGGLWDVEEKLWKLPISVVRELGLDKRIV